VTKRPSREQFAAMYLDSDMTIDAICRTLRISDTTCKHWARRFGLEPRSTGGWRGLVKAPPIVLKAEENHCNPVNDGPMFGDPTPEEIAELSAYCRARRIMEGHVSYVYIEQPTEDLAWVA
jgi:hypothetical protein